MTGSGHGPEGVRVGVDVASHDEERGPHGVALEDAEDPWQSKRVDRRIGTKTVVPVARQVEVHRVDVDAHHRRRSCRIGPLQIVVRRRTGIASIRIPLA
jgi:hypothetical protein